MGTCPVESAEIEYFHCYTQGLNAFFCGRKDWSVYPEMAVAVLKGKAGVDIYCEQHLLTICLGWPILGNIVSLLPLSSLPLPVVIRSQHICWDPDLQYYEVWQMDKGQLSVSNFIIWWNFRRYDNMRIVGFAILQQALYIIQSKQGVKLVRSTLTCAHTAELSVLPLFPSAVTPDNQCTLPWYH